ncbi:MAG: hypothetical protein NTX56_15760 [Proteobacteria bacterium]|nr:hypothetical protein [Pseudomonadota bacterium]
MDGVELFDVAGRFPGGRGFSGAACDGRYVYLAPLNNGQLHGQVARFDTTLAFDDPAAWASFDSATVHADSRGFVDAIYDGRYLYLVPYFNGCHHGQVTRYDTRQPFAAAGSWQVFDSATLHPGSRGFVSGCFDGRHVYLAPYQLDHTTTNGQVTRFDTQGDFLDPAAWQVFDTSGVHPDSRGFHSAVPAGDYVYFVPYLRQGNEYSGLLARYDRRLPFDDPVAWRHFDLTTLAPGCKGYVGGMCHDGMLYLSPYVDGTDRHGRAVRYDTRRELDDAKAWTWFDCARVDAGSRGFFGAIHAGRHLYFIPHCRGVGQYHGQITRCDLTKPFDDPASWSFCDLAEAHPDCRGFIGGVVHGGHLYLPPFETDAGRHSGLAARIDVDQEGIWRQK